MVRVTALVVGLVLACPGLLQADAPPAGTWKFFPSRASEPLWLIKLEKKEDKWVGKVIANAPGAVEATLEDLSLVKDLLSFKLKLKTVALPFEGRLPKDEKEPVRIFGSLLLRGDLNMVHLERTTLTSLDPVEINKEALARETVSYEILAAAIPLLKDAAANKAKVEEVRAWADKAVKAADAHGPLWQRQVMLMVAQALANQEGYAPVALQYARAAERLLDEKESPSEKRKILTVLAFALEKAGKAEEAKEVEARRDKIHFVNVKKYAGRKAKDGQTVLVELFTGAQAPPCVAADLAFDALEQTYRPSEVVLLQYQMHFNGPNPLANPDAEARFSFYKLESAPGIVFSGEQGPLGGGGFDLAQPRYESYAEGINKLLEKPARAAIKLSAIQKGARVEINAEVSDLGEPKGDLTLRLALVEEVVSYVGGNKLATHHCVVRTFAGGPAGFPLKEKTTSKSVTVDLDDLRKKLNEYLDKVAQDDPFPSKDRPIDMKRLRVVAFVQNNDTKEVYQSAQVPVTRE